MNKTFLNCLMAASFAISFIACNKEEVQPMKPEVSIAESERKDDTQKHKDEVLENFLASNSSRSWLYVKQINNGQDITEFVPSCNLDNIITFSANGDFLEVEGASKCDPQLPDVHDIGHWYIENGQLFVRSQHLNEDIEILELNPQSLKVKFDYEGLGTVEFWFKAAKNNIQ